MRHMFSLTLLLVLAQLSFSQLSGSLRGTLGPGTYRVSGEISVESGDTLSLLPGTTLYFEASYPFWIYGMLRAEGKESDSIHFTTDPSANPERWRGLRFCRSASSASLLSYCVVENGLAKGSTQADDFGGGIYCENSSPTFIHCLIRGNKSGGCYTGGGGVYCRDSSPQFIHCTICENSAQDGQCGSFGGGVFCTSSSPIFIGCTFRGNLGGANGGGLCCRDLSSPVFRDCMFSENLATRLGGGVFCQNSSPAFLRCLISGNSASYEGGGLYCSYSSPSFANCTFVGNSALRGGGLCCFSSCVNLNSSILAFSVDGAAISFLHSEASQVTYCDFFSNDPGHFVYPNGDSSNGPLGLGQLDGLNINGDSCDTYFNIYLDPMFVDTVAGNFHLRAGSPCINAGDPSLPLDPDGTITDIGAFRFHESAAEPPMVALPKNCVLHPNWPNPFNSRTMIRYDVPISGPVRLAVFNLLGQAVTRLVDERQLPGAYTILWDAGNLPSGVYFCRMEAADFTQTRKLILVR